MKKKLGVFLLTTFFIFGLLMSIYIHTDKQMENVADKIIRLHVVANSDSPEDQALKLKVRDAVIAKMSGKLEKLRDINEVRKLITESLGYIQSIAETELKCEGSCYPVKAVLENCEFPTKVYGNITLPAGTYQALNIIIGSGEGKNWWCVMFPPLCFIDIAHGVAPEKTTQELKTVLSEEEYKLVVAARSEEDVPVKVKFKIVEWADTMKYKAANKSKK